jgi:hypothetical protein
MGMFAESVFPSPPEAAEPAFGCCGEQEYLLQVYPVSQLTDYNRALYAGGGRPDLTRAIEARYCCCCIGILVLVHK